MSHEDVQNKLRADIRSVLRRIEAIEKHYRDMGWLRKKDMWSTHDRKRHSELKKKFERLEDGLSLEERQIPLLDEGD